MNDQAIEQEIQAKGLTAPCADCIDFGGEREAFEEAKSAIARAKGGAA